MGQGFDLAGTVRTDVQEGMPYSGTESCTVYVPQQVCRQVVVHRPDGTTHVETRCSIEQVARTGSRQYRTHTRTTTVSASAQFLDGVTKAQIGTFNGSNSQAETLRDYTGPCGFFGYMQ
jgi:hypothetical protein